MVLLHLNAFLLHFAYNLGPSLGFKFSISYNVRGSEAASLLFQVRLEVVGTGTLAIRPVSFHGPTCVYGRCVKTPSYSGQFKVIGLRS